MTAFLHSLVAIILQSLLARIGKREFRSTNGLPRKVCSFSSPRAQRQPASQLQRPGVATRVTHLYVVQSGLNLAACFYAATH